MMKCIRNSKNSFEEMKLGDPELFQQLDQIIQDQLKDGIIKEVSEDKAAGKKFYLPHKPVICQSAVKVLS